jgi:hypothetical protein
MYRIGITESFFSSSKRQVGGILLIGTLLRKVSDYHKGFRQKGVRVARAQYGRHFQDCMRAVVLGKQHEVYPEFSVEQ